jgi:hypothetical protein
MTNLPDAKAKQLPSSGSTSLGSPRATTAPKTVTKDGTPVVRPSVAPPKAKPVAKKAPAKSTAKKSTSKPVAKKAATTSAKAAAKPVAKKAAAKPVAKKATAKPAAKKAVAKAPAKKAAAKPVAKKSVTKAASKPAVTKKTVAKKTTAKKATTAKPAARKSTTIKSVAKKTVAKATKPAARKATATKPKTTAKKSTASAKTAAKSTAKKAATRGTASSRVRAASASLGESVYRSVEDVIATGKTAKDAFAVVAKDRKMTVSNVQQHYYRFKRKAQDGAKKTATKANTSTRATVAKVQGKALGAAVNAVGKLPASQRKQVAKGVSVAAKGTGRVAAAGKEVREDLSHVVEELLGQFQELLKEARKNPQFRKAEKKIAARFSR